MTFRDNERATCASCSVTAKEKELQRTDDSHDFTARSMWPAVPPFYLAKPSGGIGWGWEVKVVVLGTTMKAITMPNQERADETNQWGQHFVVCWFVFDPKLEGLKQLASS